MKRIIFFLLLGIIVCSCSKDEVATGERIPVFSREDLLKKSDEKFKINTPEPKKNSSHSGNSSPLNQKIENNLFDGDFKTKKGIKIKKYKIGRNPFGKYDRIHNPVVVNNVVYSINPNGILYAKSLDNLKKTIWKLKLYKNKDLSNFSFAKMSFSDGKLIINTGYNDIISVDIDSEKIEWIKKINSVSASYPVIDENRIYVLTTNNKTYALNKRNGEIEWIHSGIMKNTAILGIANPLIYRNMIISSYSSGEIYAVNKQTGETIWSKNLTEDIQSFTNFELTDIDATPIIKDGRIYAVNNSGKLVSLNVNIGQVIWEKNFSSITDFWLAGRFLYIINNDNILTCMEIGSGAVQWVNVLPKYKKEKKKKGLITYKNITMAGGNLLLVNNLKRVLVVSPIDGVVIKTIKLRGQAFDKPIFIDGKIYITVMTKFKTKLVEIKKP